MNSLSCKYVRDNLALFSGNELDAGDMQAIRSHLSECTECANQHLQMEHLLTALRRDTVEPPDEQAWRKLAASSFNAWQAESKSHSPQVIRHWLGKLWTIRVFSPALRPVFAFSAALLLCAVLVVTYTGDKPYDSDAFYRQHFSGITRDAVPGMDDAAMNYVVMGFAYRAQPGSFTLGVQYAYTKQACSFAFESQCSDSVQNLNRLLAEYPFYENSMTVNYAGNRTALLTSLLEVGEHIEKNVSSQDADYFLFQFGGWAQDLDFASTLQIGSITKERNRAGQFLRRAAQLNLARGVIEALTRIEALLSATALSEKANESLRKELATIYAILI